MNQFSSYAKYYDSIYQQKPYKQEVDTLENLFQKYSSIPASKVLSLGCGTGEHEIELAKRGHRVTGIDISKSMLKRAEEKIKKNNLSKKISLVQADIRDFSLNQSFDASIMMFNIAGYLHTNNDLTAVFSGVASHLKSGGIFIFDAWNQEAVLADPPTNRIKKIKQGSSLVERTTKVELDQENKLVKICFKIIEKKQGKKHSETTENHPMRYWGIKEIERCLNSSKLSLVAASSFNHIDQPVSSREWNMLVVAGKK